MTATMSRLTGGFGVARIPGARTIEEIVNSPAMQAKKAAEEAQRLERNAKLLAERAARQAHDTKVATLRAGLPAVGTSLVIAGSQHAHVHTASFEGGEKRLYVMAVVRDCYPEEVVRRLASHETNAGLRCFLTYGSYMKLMDQTHGYLEHAGVIEVKVMSHSKTGKSINVEVVERSA